MENIHKNNDTNKDVLSIAKNNDIRLMRSAIKEENKEITQEQLNY